MRRRSRLAVLGLSLFSILVVPALVSAHPLGNFTINHYAGLRIEDDRILLDVVIDQAEIPAFQARLLLDLDGDGKMTDGEIDTGAIAVCEELAGSLELRVDDIAMSLRVTAVGLSFPAGVGGLSTMRSNCGYVAFFSAPLDGPVEVVFADRSYKDRLGWREIVTQGSGVTVAIAKGELRTTSPSSRLTDYPTDLIARTLADVQIALVVTPGGPELPPREIPDAATVPATSASSAGGTEVGGDGSSGAGGLEGMSAIELPAVTTGMGVGELPAIFRTADLTPVVLLVSVLTAAALGAGHALTPGHGKTLMAAYLVGTRGTPVHAAGLGLSVAVSHTLGILVLAALVVGAQGVLPPDVVVRTAPVVAAISIVGIGGWMLWGEARRRLNLRAAKAAHHLAHEHEHEHRHEAAHEHEHQTALEHSHGGIRHSHLPPAGSAISWRSLFVLGLAGGLIPSASALLILLGSIAAGRPAFGFVLVVAFGLGMALVMGVIGFALVLARGRLDRVSGTSLLGRTSGLLPLAASLFVFGFGVYLTVQAISGTRVL